MHIVDVILAPGHGGFFYDDQVAIRQGAVQDGFSYLGTPATPGFTHIRMPAASLSIGLVLSDGNIVWGDMMSVQYAGAGGRDPLFKRDDIATITQTKVVPRLLRCDPSDFRGACKQVFGDIARGRLPLAIEYGASQALLRAAAHIHRRTMAEIICTEYSLDIPDRGVPLYAQSGDAREINVDKMILKGVDVLPHGLINSSAKFGVKGETFRTFVRWVVERISKFGGQDYRPILHFDIYGSAGREFGCSPEAIADFMSAVADDAPGYQVNIECPADFGSTEAQVNGYAAIVANLDQRGSRARVVVDERCNTLEDIELFAKARAAHIVQIKMPDVGSVADTIEGALICKQNSVGAYIGGSCVETDLSARASVHVAVATQADMMLAKPGMGVDEGLSIVGNEQSRLLTVLRHRASASIGES